MADLDDLLAQIPVADIAARVGASEDDVNKAIQTLVPVMVGGMQANAEEGAADKIAEVAEEHAASGLLDGGVVVDDVDEAAGDQAVARIFGGNDSSAVASALAGQGGADSGLMQKLLPLLAPIVLAYIGKQFANRTADAGNQAQGSGNILGDLLGGILGGAGAGASGGNNPLGSILGSVLGGGKSNNPIGDILGGLLGGNK
ncbi:MAG: DUF937 domain-containing protein [Mycobacterium sp.]|mgnify:FL=1|nr:DUF937 domain-containing protein [Mycobacterium sp.]